MRKHSYSGPHQLDLARPGHKVSSYTLPYPNGWFCVGFAREWSVGDVRPRPLMAEDVVVYRTHRGALHATRSVCPHLGTHLGIGGSVDGENLVCPMHHFSYAPDGRCVRNPFGDAPTKAVLGIRHVRERYGMVWVWHHYADEPPTWDLPSLATIGVRPPTYWLTDLKGFSQDTMENAVDGGHITELHGLDSAMLLSPFQADGHNASIGWRVAVKMPVIGTVTQEISIRFIGLGGYYALVDAPGLGLQADFWVISTPIGPSEFRYWLAFSAKPPGTHLPSMIAQPVVRALNYVLLRWSIKMAGPDLPVYYYKQYLPRPRLGDGDGPVGAFRHWASQFYPAQPTRPAGGQRQAMAKPMHA